MKKNETSEPRVDELAADLGSDLGVSVNAHNLKQALLLLRRDVLLVPVPNELRDRCHVNSFNLSHLCTNTSSAWCHSTGSTRSSETN